MKTFLWLVKREFWEHRGGFLWAPLIAGLVFLGLNIMAVITMEALGIAHHIQIGGADF